MRTIYFFILFFCVGNMMFSQAVPEYQFKNYKTPKIVNIKKAPLDFKSNATAELFKTTISETYKTAKIDFATYYISVIWGCGTGCINGAIVDVRDGKIYNLPLNPSNAYSGCFSDTTNPDKEDRYEFEKNSSLFITIFCNDSDAKKMNEKLLTKTYFVNNWDEKMKKFNFVKKVVSIRKIQIAGN